MTIRYIDAQWLRFFQQMRLPKPANDAELAIVSEVVFGVPLRLAVLDPWRYEVEQAYDSYHGKGFAFGRYSCEGYDRSKGFWEWVCGPLSCGGIAGRSYGSYSTRSHRDKARIVRWQVSRREDKGRIPRPAFVRLAAHCWEQKNSEIRGIAVPIHGPGGWSREGLNRSVAA